MNKILAVIVTYNPNIDTLRKNINSMLPYLDKILIWENTPHPDSISYRCILDSKVEYVGSGANDGIAIAFNYAWRYANDKGYDFLLTMDQDSEWYGFDEYLRTSLNSKECKNAVFCPCQSDSLLKVGFEIVDRCINSGSLLSIELLNVVGGYSEAFFVDAIDHEFCARVKRFGFKIIKNFNGRIIQQYGEQKRCSFLGLKFRSRNYSSKRLYGLVRNTRIVCRYYPHEKGIKKELYHLYMRTFVWKILLGENNKFEKISSIFKGWIDGSVYGRRYKGIIKGYIFNYTDKLK